MTREELIEALSDMRDYHVVSQKCCDFLKLNLLKKAENYNAGSDFRMSEYFIVNVKNICRLLYYNLDSMRGYVDGMVPLLVIAECKAHNYPLHILENANHSLETGDWALDIMSESEKNMLACSASGEMQSWYHDLRNLENIMVSVEKYIAMEGESACFS
ncbi:MAG: hypothetical protein LIO80_03850 [Lachnospiraceae bacterium]|nr:hypothetical protein [Lachnospiraceae bacterium]